MCLKYFDSGNWVTQDLRGLHGGGTLQALLVPGEAIA